MTSIPHWLRDTVNNLAPAKLEQASEPELKVSPEQAVASLGGDSFYINHTAVAGIASPTLRARTVAAAFTTSQAKELGSLVAQVGTCGEVLRVVVKQAESGDRRAAMQLESFIAHFQLDKPCKEDAARLALPYRVLLPHSNTSLVFSDKGREVGQLVNRGGTWQIEGKNESYNRSPGYDTRQAMYRMISESTLPSVA